MTALELTWVGAFEEGKLLGGLGYSDDDSIREIDRLFVDPVHARRGIGRALITSVLDVPEVQVSTGTANEPATNLYRTMDFVEAGVREIAPGITVTRFIRSQ